VPGPEIPPPSLPTGPGEVREQQWGPLRRAIASRRIAISLAILSLALCPLAIHVLFRPEGPPRKPHDPPVVKPEPPEREAPAAPAGGKSPHEPIFDTAANPSNDVNSPTRLKPGVVVKGRIDPKSSTAKAHYWRADLPAGRCKFVVDMERSDRKSSNILATLQLFGLDGRNPRRMERFNDLGFRSRRVFTVGPDEPRNVILRVDSDETMMDYDLGLFESSAAVTVPFFRNRPEVTPIRLGEDFASGLLDSSSGKTDSVYCSVRLPAGDYSLAVELRRTDERKSNLSGRVCLLNPDGQLLSWLGSLIELDSRAVKSFRFPLSEERDLLLPRHESGSRLY
jgi:hypothetical protein